MSSPEISGYVAYRDRWSRALDGCSRNAKALRGAANLDDVAKAARAYGLNWGTGRASDLEHGRGSPTLQTLVGLALALGEVPGNSVTLADLVHSDERIAITRDLAVTSEELQGFLNGGEVSIMQRLVSEVVSNALRGIEQMRNGWPARLQGIPPKPGNCARCTTITANPRRCSRESSTSTSRGRHPPNGRPLGNSFTQERDERAGSDANAQKKGRVARQLKAELKAVLDGDD